MGTWDEGSQGSNAHQGGKKADRCGGVAAAYGSVHLIFVESISRQELARRI